VDVTAADDPRAPADWRPVPDPTSLTTAQLRRELSALREILTARLDGMDRATTLLSETVNRTPTVIQTEIVHVRELVDEKLTSVDQRFDERDVRTDQAAKASKEALDAALLAAKELVSQQNEANAAAADKAEQSTIKQIDQIGIRIDTMQKALDDRLTELKERIDRGEGSDAGAATHRTEQRLDLSQVIAALAVLVAVVFGILLALKK
jgi:hypothetical protein